ncbi:response regulator [Paenibacillus sp. J5C_2022]|uniref:response regulator n=1 Tax=Paenibacillus sp. J5C2022 TaxID=2977129 RepID=UPI0021D1E320|nr:response regulator [Paenibacillus sp. J5C2022]MCU6708641.1 response regulator [Paenibacillus sp. J5C2022]
MRIMLVDDEKLSIVQMRMLLEKIEGIEIAGTYMDAIEAIQAVKELRPDVVFLDISMPVMNGLQAGVHIQNELPDIEIVFVTAYDSYAIQAFELNALDYLLKPVHHERLQKTIGRLRTRIQSAPSSAGQAKEGEQRICFFQNIRIQQPGREPELIKWRTNKAQELFAYLFHYRNQIVRKDSLLELLWSGIEEKKASQQLYTTIYQTRRTLKEISGEEIQIQNARLTEGYKLYWGNVAADVSEWEEKLGALAPLHASGIQGYEQVLADYEGGYLADYDYAWAQAEQDRLRRLWIAHAIKLSDYYMAEGAWEDAIRIQLHMQRVDPLVEESYFNLMKLYYDIQHPTGMEEQYRSLAAILEQELDAVPSEEVTKWYHAHRA